VFAVKPVNELVKVPIPEPLLVVLLKIVGLDVELLQQTPRDVIVAPPSPVIVPPLLAVF
jgi:hypothetical protein